MLFRSGLKDGLDDRVILFFWGVPWPRSWTGLRRMSISMISAQSERASLKLQREIVTTTFASAPRSFVSYFGGSMSLAGFSVMSNAGSKRGRYLSVLASASLALIASSVLQGQLAIVHPSFNPDSSQSMRPMHDRIDIPASPSSSSSSSAA